MHSLRSRNFVRVSSGSEIGAYYHEFFLRDKPHLAAQMFCKNARTKIAMASPELSPASALVNSRIEPPLAKQPVQQENPVREASAAHFVLASQQLDPAMRILLEHQLSLGQQHIDSQLRRLQQDSRIAASLALEMELQKKQQERLIHLQQMIALNKMSGQKKRKNNFRASAA